MDFSTLATVIGDDVIETSFEEKTKWIIKIQK